LSKTLIVEGHPSSVIEEIAARHSAGLIFTYSRYRVAPPGQQAAAPRTSVLRVAAHEVTPEWLAERFAELGSHQEMAWHSWVESNDAVFHIPMIDFVGRPPHALVFEASRMLTGEMGLSGHLVLFDTGRSFHGYFPDLIPEHAWPKYLGQLLRFNEDEHRPMVDTRWIGHALVRGFSALRWSHNTNRYQAMPRLVPMADADAQ